MTQGHWKTPQGNRVFNKDQFGEFVTIYEFFVDEAIKNGKIKAEERDLFVSRICEKLLLKRSTKSVQERFSNLYPKYSPRVPTMSWQSFQSDILEKLPEGFPRRTNKAADKVHEFTFVKKFGWELVE